MKKALIIIANIAAWMIVIFALLITILVFSSTNNNGVPQLFGFIPLTVESPSMRPTFEQGDLIVSQQVADPASLQEGDVISFWTIIDGQKVKNTHRIVRIEKSSSGNLSFITRGDNNPIDDELPAFPAEIIGKWTGMKLSGAGNIMAFLRTKLGFLICIIIPMALFFLFELYKFIVTVIRIRRPATVPQLDEEEIKRRAIEEYLAAQKEKESDSKDNPEDEKTSDAKDEEKKSESKDKPEDEKSSDAKDEEKKNDKPDVLKEDKAAGKEVASSAAGSEKAPSEEQEPKK